MSRRRRPNPLQSSLFAGIPQPPRGPGNRVRLKRQWNESGRGDAEDQAEILRGIMIDRAEPKFTEFHEYMAEVYGFKPADSTDVWQWFMVLFFPESFNVDLDTEGRKQGLLPRGGGEKVTARQLAALVAAIKRQAA